MVVDGLRNKPSSLSINSILSGEVRVAIAAVEFAIELAAVEWFRCFAGDERRFELLPPLVPDVRLFRVFDFDLNIRRRTFDDDDEVYKPPPLSFDRPFEFSISFLFVLEVVIDVANSFKPKLEFIS